MSARRRGDAGFTLVELLAAVAILGIIGAALTEAVILGLRTTSATQATSSRAAAARALASQFTDDVHSAEKVSTTDPDCAPQPVFLHLTWTDGVNRAVSYSLDPQDGPDQDVVRWSCSGGGAPTRKILGHFSRSPESASPPVSVACDPGCSQAPSEPDTVTLTIDGGRPVTVARRTAG